MHEMLLGIGLLLLAILCAMMTYVFPILLYAAIVLGLVGLYRLWKGYDILRGPQENPENAQ